MNFLSGGGDGFVLGKVQTEEGPLIVKTVYFIAPVPVPSSSAFLLLLVQYANGVL